ncbi:MAG: sigma-54-dependent Fis family transcriptional regulator [Opitutae bacterium]|nr:sigma-54-dependent Fis family transcriptional regulator [Opitutae bacterium]
MAIEKIVVVDDEMMIRKSLETQLRNKRYSVASAEDLKGARKILSRDAFDLVFLDMRLPDGDGMELLEELAVKADGPMVVMMTGFGSVESAVACMQTGAFDYVLKPFSFDQVEVVVDRAASFDKMKLVNRYYVEEEGSVASEIVGKSPAINHLKEMVMKVAKTEASVLVTGENGTGKELVAKELHKNSLLTDQPYIRVNCAAISETLMESEFFGHEKGSFTGATQRREGRFELADGGTILLDEISEIAPSLQAKLLRVLQEKEFERVGGDKTIQVKVRVLTTTNRNLIEEVQKGNFREDLYYRLNVFPIEVPPLRDRVEDIPLLAETFLTRQARKHGLSQAKFSKQALTAMLAHSWPGNVRELENSVERAVILAEQGKAIGPELLGLGTSSVSLNKRTSPSTKASNGSPVISPKGSAGEVEIPTMEQIEKEHILLALQSTGGNRTKTADLLEINVRTLRNKIRQYKLDGAEVP